MKQILCIFVILALGAGILPGTTRPVFCQEPAVDTWRFQISPYFFTGRFGVDNTVGSVDFPLNVSVGDASSNLRFSGGLHLEAAKGRFGAATDLAYIKIEDEFDLGAAAPTGATGKSDLERLDWDIFAAFRFNPDERPQAFEFFLGLRYLERKLLASDTTGNAGGYDENWVDPFFGVRYLLNLGSRFYLRAHGDMGGIDFGSAISWRFISGFGVRATQFLDLYLNVRLVYLNRMANSEGTETFFRYKGNESDILVGVNVTL